MSGRRRDVVSGSSWPPIPGGALDIARKKFFLILCKRTMAVETPTKPSSVWTVIVCRHWEPGHLRFILFTAADFGKSLSLP